MRSIRQRLLLWLLVGLALVLSRIRVCHLPAGRAEINALFDYQLNRPRWRYAIKSADPGVSADPSEGESDLLVQIWDRNRGPALRLAQLAELPFATRQGFTDLLWREQSWRLFALNVGDRIVQNRPADPRAVADERRHRPAQSGTVPAVVTGNGRGDLVRRRRGAATVAPTRRRIRKAAVLTPGAGDVDSTAREITPLIDALNDLLTRIGRTLDTQRQFIADAAHELRTPLNRRPSVKPNWRNDRPSAPNTAGALADLRIGLERATHLVEQLWPWPG